MIRLAKDDIFTCGNQNIHIRIQDNKVWSMYKKAQASIWTAEGIDLRADHSQYQELSPDEQHFLSHLLLPFFVTTYGIIIEKLLLKFFH
jgi:ribonucleoside-diphosphate reductase subunit M2